MADVSPPKSIAVTIKKTYIDRHGCEGSFACHRIYGATYDEIRVQLNEHISEAGEKDYSIRINGGDFLKIISGGTGSALFSDGHTHYTFEQMIEYKMI